jgi:hypothetical protein
MSAASAGRDTPAAISATTPDTSFFISTLQRNCRDLLVRAPKVWRDVSRMVTKPRLFLIRFIESFKLKSC